MQKMIRPIQLGDASWICDIWEKWYKNEMPCPNFLDKYLCAFTITNNDQPVIIGGVRTIVESILLTDKNQSVRKRVNALYEAFDASKVIASRNGYNNLNVFTSDKEWKNHLIRNGFVSEEVLTLQL